MPCYAPNKIKYSNAEKQFIKQYYGKLPNTDILKQVNTMRETPVNMSALRHQMRRMRLITGVRLINWTAEQTAFLLANYRTMGNLELIDKLNKLKLSKRKFKKKAIEKKMILLGIKRTPEELRAIVEKHKAAGAYPGRVHAQPQGAVVVRIMAGLPHPHVKQGDYFVKQARVVYKQHHGEIPPRHMVHFADLDTMNLHPDNLILKKIGDLTFNDKSQMLKIARENIARMNKPPVTEAAPERGTLDSSRKIEVRINNRLTLYVKPGTDIEALRAKYDRPLNPQTVLQQPF